MCLFHLRFTNQASTKIDEAEHMTASKQAESFFLPHFSFVLDSKINISQNPFHHMLETKPFSSNKEQEDKLNCCEECASNYEKEAQFLKPEQKKTLPFWLQSHGTEEQKKVVLMELLQRETIAEL
ncbi:hypothetical protein P8452_42851 [Trifolium repens]|nr:hypothetical protein P8452_42851 [Trifolium repens]